MVNWNETKAFLQERMNGTPEIGLILGSGLGVLADEIENPVAIPYEDIPHFPVSTVEGHAGQLVFGDLEGKRVVAMQGRFHFYEGYSMEQVTFPVRVLKLIGVETLIVTNAAGACNENFNPGDLMIITDHINFFGTSPLIGKNANEFGTRFPDMSEAYDKQLVKLTEQVASDLGLNVQKGVYFGNTGPTYETPAEVRMARLLGGDVVGMSTVPEVIVARHSDMRVLGISCVSNMAAGILDQPLNHEEVIETTERVRQDFLSLVRGTIKSI
ncbi:MULTISPECIES: purine-nucleoside phosphorylase [Exiguobacterium]|uniref:Purine nucleoside phosphorylase n=1 Tax=Exiguobacterium alkaliphilum TaxID=1428684 RepID=A0ABT2KVD3_9BACL|nr:MULTISPECIES: purine-nucleoside phosphorylase [Exiguobacterium]KDN59157.1 purine nucleoside phosphorylase [Exiguobacterium sp. AB2]MCT4794345.1 purine-nucleoside phosphorylase [Exiguobacterium alkaliphilum]QUE85182.1 purine-nucleoside phosphorylase [Exiguobacterium alkaliphilum]